MSTITDVLPLLREMNELKRVRVGGRPGTLADQLFLRAWGRLARGEQLSEVAPDETARAIVAVRLGGIDVKVLGEAGLSEEEILTIFERAFDDVMEGLDAKFAANLKMAIRTEEGYEPEEGDMPELAQLLVQQPRAELERGLIEPEETLAEHSAVVAVNSFLTATFYGASPERAFLMGLCHRIHNAYLPDAGEVGEHLLGDKRSQVIEAFRARAVASLPVWLQGEVRASLDALDAGDSPEARAFRASDSIDHAGDESL